MARALSTSVPLATSTATRRVWMPVWPGRANSDSDGEGGYDGSGRVVASGHGGGQRFIDVDQHRQHALANGRHLHARQLEAEAADDVVLLDRRLALPEQARLRIVVGEQGRLAAYLVLHHRLREAGEARHLPALERTTAAQRVRFVRHAAAVDGLAVHAIALVVVHLRDGRVDRDLVEVRTTQAADLRVHVRVDTALQQRVVGEVDARHDVGRAEGHLLGLGEEVFGIAVQDHLTDGLQRHQLFRHDLGGIQHVEGEAVGLLFGEDLDGKLVFGELARLDGFPQVAAVEVGIGAADLHGLVPHQRVGALQGRPVELDEDGVAYGVDQAEGVHAEALHGAVAARDRAVRHGPHQHVHRFGHQRGEVPERIVRAGRLRDRVVRLRLDGVDQVGELHRVLDEEDGDVVADQVPVAFVGIELDGETAHVARRVGRTAFACDGGEAHEHGRLLTWGGEDIGAGQRGQVLVAFEIAVGGRAARMHDAFGDALMVEVRDLLAQDEVFHQGRSTQAGLQRILVVGDGHALVGGHHAVRRIGPYAVQRGIGVVHADGRLAGARLGRGDVLDGRAGDDDIAGRLGGLARLRVARGVAVLAWLVDVVVDLVGQVHAAGLLLQQYVPLRVVVAQGAGRLGVGRS